MQIEKLSESLLDLKGFQWNRCKGCHNCGDLPNSYLANQVAIGKVHYNVCDTNFPW